MSINRRGWTAAVATGGLNAFYLNQLILGHAYLNYMTYRLDPSKSANLNGVIHVIRKKTIIHYLHDCKKFDKEGRTLAEDIDRILVTNGL